VFSTRWSVECLKYSILFIKIDLTLDSNLTLKGRKKVHFTFQEGTSKIELAEEYNLNTGEIIGN
jgi:hypothetical protein